MISVKKLIATFMAAVLPCCCAVHPAQVSSVALATEAVASTDTTERDYLIKGMTCSGCVFGVKQALKRAGVSASQIVDVEYNKPQPEQKIGHARVRFSKEEYRGKETDCKIAKEVFKNPGYKVFWDEKEMNPCDITQ